jgi:CBS-domain-containing membrane protein
MRHYLTVADVMTPEVVTVTEDTPFKTVAKLLAEHHLSAVPVMNVYGGVAGVVSETDLPRKEEFQRVGRHPFMGWWRHRAKAKATPSPPAPGRNAPAPTATTAAASTTEPFSWSSTRWARR